MESLDSWRALHAERFPELTFDCGRTADAGVRFSEELRDWSDKATTPDQRRMELYIDRYDLRQKRILHVGIGNSGLAQRFHRRVKEIVGITIDEPEMKVAHSLGLPNYRFMIHNKYSGQNNAIDGCFDVILDNNPTSPCCCVRHLAAIFQFYAGKLGPTGQLVTDREGLEWVPENSNARWCFSFDDLAAAGSVVGLCAYRGTETVYILSRTRPVAPTVRSLSAHAVRRTADLAGRAARRLRRLTVS